MLHDKPGGSLQVNSVLFSCQQHVKSVNILPQMRSNDMYEFKCYWVSGIADVFSVSRWSCIALVEITSAFQICCHAFQQQMLDGQSVSLSLKLHPCSSARWSSSYVPLSEKVEEMKPPDVSDIWVLCCWFYNMGCKRRHVSSEDISYNNMYMPVGPICVWMDLSNGATSPVVSARLPVGPVALECISHLPSP